MTISCADSIRVADLLPGYDSYLGYVDGIWVTVHELAQAFPGKPVIGLTVQGGRTVADGCDCETGDLSPDSAARWLHDRIAAGQKLPILYQSVSGIPETIRQLEALGVHRDEVRVLSAHYGAGEHICGPKTCRQLDFDADGTQWTDAATGRHNSQIDASVLRDGFFGGSGPAAPTWEDELMATISTVKQGDRGQPVKNWQGLLVAHGHQLGTSGPAGDGVDGVFGQKTQAGTLDFQRASGLKEDGLVGRNTWTAALS